MRAMVAKETLALAGAALTAMALLYGLLGLFAAGGDLSPRTMFGLNALMTAIPLGLVGLLLTWVARRLGARIEQWMGLIYLLGWVGVAGAVLLLGFLLYIRVYVS